MLVVSRRPGESFYIDLAADVDPSTPIGEVFAGPVEVQVRHIVKSDQVRIGIDAPDELNIARSELVEGEGLVLGL